MTRLLRSAIRSLGRTPGVTALVIATLSIGIALVTGMFALVNGWQWARLPYHEAERVVLIVVEEPRSVGESWLSSDLVNEVRSLGGVFQQTAAYDKAPRTLRAGGITVPVSTLAADPSLLPLLRVALARGRYYTADDGDAVAVITYAAWRKYFAGSPNVIGESLHIDGKPHAVVGVLAEGVGFENADVFTPLRMQPGDYATMLGRLADGVDIPGARARIAGIRIANTDDYDIGSTVSLNPDMVGRDSAMNAAVILIPFAIATMFVLLIACWNVVAVLLARGVSRRTSYAVRAALGASRRQLMLDSFAESVCVAAVSAVLGIMLASWAIHAIVGLLPSGLHSWLTFPIDVNVGVFAGFTALFAMLAIGWLPAREAASVGPMSLLNNTTVTKGAGESRIVRTLVSAEVAFSVALFIGTVLIVRSFDKSREIDAGYDDRALAVAQVRLESQDARFIGRSAIDDYLARSEHALNAVPATGRAWIGVFAGLRSLPGDSVPAYVNPTQTSSTKAGLVPDALSVVSDDYFRTIGLGLVGGRTFNGTETQGSGLKAVVSVELARRLWDRASPVGQTLRMELDDGVTATVIGVVSDRKRSRSSRRGVSVDPQAEIYFSTRQALTRDLSFIARAPGAANEALESEAGILAQQMSGALQHADPDVAVYRAESLYQRNRMDMIFLVILAKLFGGIATVALLLAMIGLFGVVAYAAKQRTREIGVRMALGAAPGRIAREVLEHALRIIGSGLAVGFGLAFIMGQMMRSMLFGVSTLDPVTYVSVAALFTAVALLAAWLPSLRAMRVDPIVALRPE